MFTKNNASKSLIDAVSSILEKKPVVEEKTQPQVISEEQVSEVAPPGFEGTVKAMKKYPGIDNPFALAWSMKKKGYKSHKKADGSPKNEEFEQIDEISSGLATSYLNKRTAQHKPNLNSPETSNRDAKVAKGISSASRREHGFGPDKSAANKVTGRFEYRKNVGATHTFNKEEVEQIDELSKGTLGSYVKGAARDMGASRSLAKDFERDAKSAKKPNTKDINTRLSNKFNKIASKRNAGIGKAVERLTKEEMESIDEALKGNQHKIDKNKNNKIDAQDFKILRKEDIESFDEALKGNQHEIDKNHNKKIDAQDFRILRAKMKKEEVETVEEGWDDMVKAAKEKVSSGPKPSGGSGVKQGTRYGGSKQKDEPEEKKKN